MEASLTLIATPAASEIVSMQPKEPIPLSMSCGAINRAKAAINLEI